MADETRTPQLGDTLRLEGEAFTIDALEVFKETGDGRRILRPGVMHADLPANVEKLERKQYDIHFNAADLIWSERHQAWCLRDRGVHVHPVTGDPVGDEEQAALAAFGTPALWRPDTF